jgi:uncharacterized protein DUF4038/uncharacterized protein DUF5060/collagenase-like protein with putative collagen-binding domain
MIRAFPLAFVASLMLASQAFAARTVSFEPSTTAPVLYSPWEIVVRVAQPTPQNPFDATITATFSPAGGAPITVHGFCDSQDGTLYRVRFTPQKQVHYNWTATFTDSAGSASSSGGIDAGWSNLGGFIRRDSKFPAHFVDERTNRHWFHHGCTALVMMGVTESSARAFIDRMTGFGFDRCRIFLSAGIRTNLTDQVIDPFLGTNYTQFTVSWWQRLDRLVAYMQAKGMVADLNVESDWGSYAFSWADRQSITPNERRFYHYAIDRLASYPNVTWNLGNEYIEYHSSTWANNMGAEIKAYDPYGHLLTGHPNNNVFVNAGSSWADTVPLQAYSGGSAVTQRTTWSAITQSFDAYRSLGKPMINDEYGYESPYSVTNVRKSHWTSIFSGAYATYGSNESITWKAGDDRLFNVEVADAQLRVAKDFMTSTDWWQLNYDPGVVTASTATALPRAIRGQEYAIYLPDGGSVTAYTGDTQGLALPIEWIDPATGQRTPAGTTQGLASITVTSPLASDALLHVGQTLRNSPVLYDFDSPGQNKNFHKNSGRWAATHGGLVSLDRTLTGITTLVGKTYDDVTVDFDLLIDDVADKKAGVCLRRRKPSDILQASGVRVSYYGDGRVEIIEPRGDGTLAQLAIAPAPVWNPRGVNHCAVTIRNNRILAFANGTTAVASSAIRYGTLDAGYVALYTQSVRALFDNFKTRPIFYRDFENGLKEGIVPITGVWGVSNSRLTQDSTNGGHAGLQTAPLTDFTFDFQVRALNDEVATDLGASFRVASPTAPFGQSGYSLRFDNLSRVELLVNDPVNGRTVLASYDDPPGAPLILRNSLNHFTVRVAGSHINVTLTDAAVPIIDVDDPSARWASGCVQLDASRFARYDSITLKRDA